MFFFFTSTAISSAILMLLSSNPVNAVLFLIAVFISTSLLFLLLNAEFLALVFIIVYVGAIAVLFLFIVMMINIKKIEKDNTTYLTIGLIILLLFILQIGIVLIQPTFTNTNTITMDTYYLFGSVNFEDESLRYVVVQRLGYLLYKVHPVLLLLAGFILLVAMIGAIYLTNQKRGFSMRRQLNQLARDTHIVHVNIY